MKTLKWFKLEHNKLFGITLHLVKEWPDKFQVSASIMPPILEFLQRNSYVELHDDEMNEIIKWRMEQMEFQKLPPSSQL